MKNFVRFLLLVLPAISMLAPGTANSETLLQAVRKKTRPASRCSRGSWLTRIIAMLMERRR